MVRSRQFFSLAAGGLIAAIVVEIAISDAQGLIGTAERTMLYREVR